MAIRQASTVQESGNDQPGLGIQVGPARGVAAYRQEIMACWQRHDKLDYGKGLPRAASISIRSLQDQAAQ